MKKHELTRLLSVMLTVCILFTTLATVALAADIDTEKALFIEAVENIENAPTLNERYEYLEQADARLQAYTAGGGDVTEAAFAEAYSTYLELAPDIRLTVDACNSFMDHVELALMNDGVSFVTMKEHLDAAAALIPSIDESFTGVSGLLNSYNELFFIYQAKIEICEGYITFAAMAAEAETYADADEYVKRAKDYLSQITILDYPNLDTAAANIDLAMDLMAQKVAAAQRFIHTVNDLHKTDNIAKAIRDAYAIIEEDGVDITAEGASAAYEALRTAELSYKNSVRKANATQEDVMNLIFAFIH